MQSYETIIGIIKMRMNGHTWNECAQRHRVGKGTVQKILTRYSTLSIPIQDLIQMNPSEVVAAFFPPENKRRKEIPFPDCRRIADAIMGSSSGTNLFFEWQKYKIENPAGYQYTQFVEHFKRYAKEHGLDKSLKMAVERSPGERIYIDWVGDQPKLVVDTATGELRKAHIFVTTVGVSSKIYAEAFPDERMGNFVLGTVHAINFYGALPKYLVPDNASTAVKRHTKDGILLSSTYSDLESFYDVVVLPPPPYKPKGKATVEKAVQIIEGWVSRNIRAGEYASFAQLNEKISELVEAINSATPHGWECSRQEMFERYDKPCMKAIKDRAFTTCEYVSFSRVPDNYHLEFDGHYYSVFYTYYGKPVILKATISEIRLCDENNKVICKHDRIYAKYPKYSTKEEHMPPHHRFYKEVNSRDGGYYRRWASSIGDGMKILIDVVLASAKHEEQAYNACNGILHACDKQPKEICNSAAKRCVEVNCCKYSYFKRILSESMNGESARGEELPRHENIRGKDFYS